MGLRLGGGIGLCDGIRASTLIPDWRGTSAGFRDTGISVAATGGDGSPYQRRHPLAYVLVDTDATQVDVECYTNYRAIGSGYAHVTWEVEGLGYGVATTTTNNATNTTRVTLAGSGTRRVRFTDGQQTAMAGVTPPSGTWLTRLTRVDGTTLTVVPATAPTTEVIFVGDSIYSGANANTPGRQSLGTRIRQQFGPTAVGVTHVGYGYRALASDYAAGHFTALVAEVVAAASQCATAAGVVVYVELGINDQGRTPLLWPNSGGGVASFQTAYQTLLTELRAALPSARIVSQTITGTTLAANADGQTIAQYVTAQQAAFAGAALSNATQRDGSTVITATDVTEASGDGVHPQSWGHGRAARRTMDNEFSATQLYGAGTFSASNMLRTASGTHVDVANGTSLLFVWRQRANGSANMSMVTCASGTSSNGTGWGLFQSDAGGSVALLRYRPSGFGFGLATLGVNLCATAGLHAVAVSIASDGTVVACADGGRATAGGVGTYTTASATRLEFGTASAAPAFVANPNFDAVALATIPYVMDEYDLSWLSYLALTQPPVALLERATVLWEARADYDATRGTTPQTTRGTAPVSLVQTGSVPRVAVP